MTAESTFDEPYPFCSMVSVPSGNIILKSVAITGDAGGQYFFSRLRQIYINDANEPLALSCHFPVSINTAILKMDATIGQQKLHAREIKRVNDGKGCELVMESGHSVWAPEHPAQLQSHYLEFYTASLGALAPGEIAMVDIHCGRQLNLDQGRVRLGIPAPGRSPHADLHFSRSARPCASILAGTITPCEFRIAIWLYGDAIRDFTCLSPGVTMDKKQNSACVSLCSHTLPESDLVILYTLSWDSDMPPQHFNGWSARALSHSGWIERQLKLRSPSF